MHLNLSGLPKEFCLVLSCLRLSERAQEAETIEELIRGPFDWGSFIAWVDRHRVAPLVYRDLCRREWPNIPEHTRRGLRHRFEGNARRALALATEMVSILRLFERDGIAVLPLKGPVLALKLYGDLGLRHAGDLDLLVAPKYVGRAEYLLRERGYRRVFPNFDLTPKQHSTYTRCSNQFAYYCQDRRIRVELHWRFSSDPQLFPLRIEEAWNERQTVDLAGTHVATLSPEHTILFLCAHGALHAWHRLFWLCDIAGLLNGNHTIDWELLMVRGAELGVRRRVAEGLVLSNLLLGYALPDPARVYAGQDRAVDSLVKMAFHIIINPEGPAFRPFTRAYMHSKLHEFNLRDDLEYKCRCVLTKIYVAPGDWKIVPMPDALFPLYCIIRPFTWLFRWYVRGASKIDHAGLVGKRENGNRGTP